MTEFYEKKKKKPDFGSNDNADYNQNVITYNRKTPVTSNSHILLSYNPVFK